ncbi:MAG: hydrogenase maturation nickel metallochaperone HypA [Mycobacteriales bacterium]
MHELSYAEAALEAVERRAHGRRVARVGVRIGCVHRVVAAAFAHSFALAAVGGVAEQALTELTVVPAQGHCWDCSEDFTTSDPGSACPRCGSLEVVVTGGDEVVLEWLEYVDGREGAGEPVAAHTHGGS